MIAMADKDSDFNTDGKVISDYVHPHSVNAGIPTEAIKPPSLGKNFEVDEAVLEGKPVDVSFGMHHIQLLMAFVSSPQPFPYRTQPL